jgi:hypothetical protein
VKEFLFRPPQSFREAALCISQVNLELPSEDLGCHPFLGHALSSPKHAFMLPLLKGPWVSGDVTAVAMGTRLL